MKDSICFYTSLLSTFIRQSDISAAPSPPKGLLVNTLPLLPREYRASNDASDPSSDRSHLWCCPACEPFLLNLASSKLAVWCIGWIRQSGVPKTIPVELLALRRAPSALSPSEEGDDYESCPDPLSAREVWEVGVPLIESGLLTRARAHLNKPRRERTGSFERLWLTCEPIRQADITSRVQTIGWRPPSESDFDRERTDTADPLASQRRPAPLEKRR